MPRDYVADVLLFIGKCGEQNLAPMTINTRVAAVLEFLMHHNREISDKDRKRIRSKVPRGGAVSKRDDLTHEMLREILSHMEEHGEALVLMLASSGMRIGEAVAIRITDVDLEAVPAEVDIRPEFAKNRVGRTAFISSEAVTAIRSWLLVRDGWLSAAVARASGCVAKKSIQDPRLFPFSVGNGEAIWNGALAAAGLAERDPRTGRMTRTPHSLRGFFSSQLGLTCPEPIVQVLVGHEGYLTDAYRRYTKTQLGEHYLEAEHHVLILVPQEYKDLKTKVSKRQEAQMVMVEDLSLRNHHLESRVAALEAENATILEAAGILKQMTEHPRLREVLRKEALEREEPEGA